MSVKHIGLAWELPEDIKVKPQELLVLLALADRANPDTNECWPGRRDIARRCRMSVRTVDKYIAELKKKKLLKSKPRRRFNRSQTSNTYTLTLPQAADPPRKQLHGGIAICYTPRTVR